MLFQNVIYYGEDFRFHRGSVKVEEGKIVGISEIFDSSRSCESYYLIPGFIDLHCHGAAGFDFSDGDPHGLAEMARYLGTHGITSFSPASVTLPEHILERAYRNAARFQGKNLFGHAKLQGITMEGPFFSEKYKGAQAEAHLLRPNLELFDRLNTAADHMIRIVCVAPELEGADAFIKAVSQRAVVSLGHTAADYETARSAFQSGARHLTHLFNAMSPMHHRVPGIIGAAADASHVTTELICDGIHVHESMVRVAFKLFGADRIVLISDAMQACGMEDGIYELGGQKVTKTGSRAVLEDGTLAGSVSNLYDCVKKAIAFGIRMEDALRAATYNPAAVLGILGETGSIGVGKCADLLVCDQDLNLYQVYINGELVACIRN